MYANEDQIHEEMKDPITHRPIYDPKDLPCQHTFSATAIRAHLREHGECPLDNKKFTEADLVNPSPSLKRILDALKVLCPNKCGQVPVGIARDQLAGHLEKDCPLLLVPCANASCVEQVARKNLASHVEACPETPVGCEHKNNGCAATPLRKQAADHGSKCDYAMIPCEQRASGCRESFLRRQLAEHNKSCEFFRVPCGNQGCGKLFMRKELATHMDRECDQRTLLCTKGCAAAMRACEAHAHNCVATLRSVLATAEASLQAQALALKETQEAAHTQLAAKDAEVAELKQGLRDQGEKLEALVVLLARAVGEHHGLQRALLETGAVLADARRRGRPAPPAEPQPLLVPCGRLGCEQSFVAAKNHALACRYHPGQLRMRSGTLDYNCCNRKDGSAGCTIGAHVVDEDAE